MKAAGKSVDGLVHQASLLKLDDALSFDARDAHSPNTDSILFPRKSLLPAQAQKIILRASQESFTFQSSTEVYEIGEVLMAGRKQCEFYVRIAY